MTPETVAILLRAAARVEDRGWCQYTMAVGTQGQPDVDPRSEIAVRRSLYGAVSAENLEERPQAPGFPYMTWGQLAIIAVNRLLLRLGEPQSVQLYNDVKGRTATEVAHLLRAAALECLWPGEWA